MDSFSADRFWLRSAWPLVLWLESEPHNADDIRRYSGLLNEIAAINVPHNDFLSDEQRRYHAVLLEKVESGLELNPGESSEYRQLIQSVLLNYQSRLVWLDRNLTVLSDVGMDRRKQYWRQRDQWPSRSSRCFGA